MSAGTMTTTVEVPGWPPGRVPYRISVPKYEAMIASGAFTEDDRLELIEGALVQKMTKGRKHSAGSEKVWRAIQAILTSGWHVRIEKPVRIPARDSMPEPDVSVARGEVDDYLDHDPSPPDVALVVEVSDTTLAADRALAATYIAGGIPAYWLLNVLDRQLEVYSTGGDAPAIVGESGSVELLLDGQATGRIAVADLLPRA
jgi:Uma2 family endonuclease